MPAPTNTSFLTATDLGTLPAVVTQTVDFSGTTYTVYYAVTPTVSGMISAFLHGALATYTATTRVYVGPASAPTAYPSLSDAVDVPIQFYATAGVTYLFRITPPGGNPSPANLTVNVEQFTNLPAPRLSVLITDDTDPLPATVFQADDGTVLRFEPFPAGEGADTLDDGTICTQSSTNVDGNVAFYTTNTGNLAFASNLQVFSGLSGDQPRVISSNRTDTFYVGMRGLGATHARIAKVTRAGGVIKTWTLPAAGLLGVAPSPDGSILYNIGQTSSANAPVKKWATAGSGSMGADLITTTGAVTQDLLCFSNGSVVYGYSNAGNMVVRCVTSGGVESWATTVLTGDTDSSMRIAHIPLSQTSFMVWLHVTTAGFEVSRLLTMALSDGSVTDTSSDIYEFESGVAQFTATLTPPARYGHSFSCPLVILPSAIGASTTTYTIRRQRRFLLPSSPDNKTMQIPTLELLMRTGIGLTPGAASDPPVQGSDPQVMLRISKDGGKTWLPERWASAGTQGNYKDRVRWLRATGNYRNAVCEVTVSDPVDWQWLAMLGSPVEGSS